MTTIIGIAGRDPETLEDYVVIASDTRGTINGNFAGDSDRKIFGNTKETEKGNYVFGTSGKCLEGVFPEKKYKLLNDFLFNPITETKESIENKLSQMNSNIKEFADSGNHYLVSISEEIPKIYYFNGTELVESGAYSAIGSGMEHTTNLNSLKKHKKDGRIILSKKEVLKVAENAMIEASSNDSSTGGKMDVAIVSKSGIRFISGYARISDLSSKKENFYQDDDFMQRGIHPYQRGFD